MSILISGTLYKKGVIFGKWSPRYYYIYKPEHGIPSFCSKNNPKKDLLLDNFDVLLNEDESNSEFLIETRDKVLLLRANNAQDCAQWVAILSLLKEAVAPLKTQLDSGIGIGITSGGAGGVRDIDDRIIDDLREREKDRLKETDQSNPASDTEDDGQGMGDRTSRGSSEPSGRMVRDSSESLMVTLKSVSQIHSATSASSCYAVLTLGDVRQQSSVVPLSEHSVFEWQIDFPVRPQTMTLDLIIYAHDSFGFHQSLGSLHLPVSHLESNTIYDDTFLLTNSRKRDATVHLVLARTGARIDADLHKLAINRLISVVYSLGLSDSVFFFSIFSLKHPFMSLLVYFVYVTFVVSFPAQYLPSIIPFIYFLILCSRLLDMAVKKGKKWRKYNLVEQSNYEARMARKWRDGGIETIQKRERGSVWYDEYGRITNHVAEGMGRGGRRGRGQGIVLDMDAEVGGGKIHLDETYEDLAQGKEQSVREKGEIGNGERESGQLKKDLRNELISRPRVNDGQGSIGGETSDQVNIKDAGSNLLPHESQSLSQSTEESFLNIRVGPSPIPDKSADKNNADKNNEFDQDKNNDGSDIRVDGTLLTNLIGDVMGVRDREIGTSGKPDSNSPADSNAVSTTLQNPDLRDSHIFTPRPYPQRSVLIRELVLWSLGLEALRSFLCIQSATPHNLESISRKTTISQNDDGDEEVFSGIYNAMRITVVVLIATLCIPFRVILIILGTVYLLYVLTKYNTLYVDSYPVQNPRKNVNPQHNLSH